MKLSGCSDRKSWSNRRSFSLLQDAHGPSGKNTTHFEKDKDEKWSVLG